MPTFMKNGKYRGKVRLARGKIVTKTFLTHDAAQDWETRSRQRIAKGLGPEKVWRPTVGEFFASAFERQYDSSVSYHANKSYMNKLVDLLGPDLCCSKVTMASARSLNNVLLKEGRKPQSVNALSAVFNTIMKQAYRDGLTATLVKMEYNASIAVPKERFVTPEEEQAIINALSDQDADLATFLMYTGLRISEALSLQVDALKDSWLTFQRLKGGKITSMPIPAIAVEAFNRSARRTNSPSVFASMDRTGFLKRLKKACAKLGIEDVTPHTFRHTAASRLVQGGVDLRRVQAFLGHKALSMTMRYAHLAPENLLVAADVLDQVATMRGEARA